jgi:outer membrane autotransporter protein
MKTTTHSPAPAAIAAPALRRPFYILHSAFFICLALALATPPATAQTTKGVTTIASNTTESNITYSITTGNGPILTINAVTYVGTNINLISTSPNTAAGKWLLRLQSNANATLHGGTLTQPTTAGGISGASIFLYNGNNGTRLTAEDLLITSLGPTSKGISLNQIAAGQRSSTLDLTRTHVKMDGPGSAALDFAGDAIATLTSSTLAVTGSGAAALTLRSAIGAAPLNLTLHDTLLQATGADSPAIYAHANNAHFTHNLDLNHSTIQSTQASGLDINYHTPVPHAVNATANYTGTYNIRLDHTTLTGATAGIRATTTAVNANGTTAEQAATILNLTLANSSTLAGGIHLAGAAKLNLAADPTSLVTGGIHLSDKAILNLHPDDLDRIDGGLTLADTSAISVAAPAPGAPPATFTRNLALSGSTSIRFEGDTLFTGTLNFADAAGIIIANVSGADLTLAPGAAFNGDPALRVENITTDILGRSRIPLIADTTGASLLATTTLTLIPNEIPGSARVDFGRYGYSLETTATSADLVLTRRQFRNATTGTWRLSDITYESTPAGTQHAFYLDATGDLAGSTFTGTNITILAGGTGANVARMALVVTGGAEATIHGGTLAQTNPNAADSLTTANYVYANSKLHLTDALLYATAPKIRALGIQSSTTDGAYITLERTHVYTTGTAPAFIFGGRGYVTMHSTTLATHGPSAPAAQFRGAQPEFYFTDGEITATGPNSPGMWLGGSADFAGLTQMKITLKNTRVASTTAAGIDINTFIPALNDLPDPRATQPSWFADFDLTAENTTITGPAAALRITSRPYWNSNVNNYASGTTFFADIPTTVRLNLKNTGTLAGDLLLTATPDHAAATAASAATVESPRALTPPVTATLILNLDHSVLAGAYRASARTTSTLALRNSSTLTGPLELTGDATAAITLAASSIINGPITLAGSSTATITFDATSRLPGGLRAADTATLTLDPAPGAAVTAPLTLSGAARLLIARPITLDGPLTLDDAGTAIAFARVAGHDLVLGENFTLAGNGKITLAGIAPPAATLDEIHLIDAPAGNFPLGALTLDGGLIDLGLAGYTLDTRPDGAWLVGGLGSVGAAMYDTAATAALEWLSALDPIHSHLASLRPHNPAAHGTGALWLDARASYLTAKGAGNLSFNQHTTALAAGGDTRWPLSTGDAITGFCLEYAAATRDFALRTDGSTATAAAALYAEWRHPRGLYLGALARLARNTRQFDSNDPGNRLDAEYKTRDLGLAIETGWRLASASRGLWLEPSLQAAHVRLGGKDYAIRRDAAIGDDDLAVSLENATARQYRAQVRAGRDTGPWRCHARIAAARIDSAGGAVRVPACPGLPETGPDLDGTRLEFGLGLQRALGKSGLLHCEGSYIKARAYELPWTLNLAYSHLW